MAQKFRYDQLIFCALFRIHKMEDQNLHYLHIMLRFFPCFLQKSILQMLSKNQIIVPVSHLEGCDCWGGVYASAVSKRRWLGRALHRQYPLGFAGAVQVRREEDPRTQHQSEPERKQLLHAQLNPPEWHCCRWIGWIWNERKKLISIWSKRLKDEQFHFVFLIA